MQPLADWGFDRGRSTSSCRDLGTVTRIAKGPVPMSLGLAVVLWAANLAPVAPLPPVAPMDLTRSDLARTDAVLRGIPASHPDIAVPRLPHQRPAPDETAKPDLAVLLGTRHQGGQFEMGALGGGRADEPGLVHIGLGFDF